jgi:hypothetical protein
MLLNDKRMAATGGAGLTIADFDNGGLKDTYITNGLSGHQKY